MTRLSAVVFSSFTKNVSLTKANFPIPEIVLIPALSVILVFLIVLLAIAIKRYRKTRREEKAQAVSYKATTKKGANQTGIGVTSDPAAIASRTAPITEEVSEYDVVQKPLAQDELIWQNPVKETAPLEPERETINLTGIGGFFDNREIRQFEAVIIGRDPRRCTLVYPMSEKGISSVHCRIQTTESGCTLTDLGSQFGTFVNGQKLEPNVPYTLQKGDTFWLADRVNSFYLPEL